MNTVIIVTMGVALLALSAICIYQAHRFKNIREDLANILWTNESIIKDLDDRRARLKALRKTVDDMWFAYEQEPFCQYRVSFDIDGYVAVMGIHTASTNEVCIKAFPYELGNADDFDFAEFLAEELVEKLEEK